MSDLQMATGADVEATDMRARGDPERIESHNDPEHLNTAPTPDADFAPNAACFEPSRVAS